MQADAVVDAVDGAVHAFENVAALAVGVVEDDIEHGHPLQSRVVGVDECDVAAVHVARVQHGQPPVRYCVDRADVDEVEPVGGIFAGVDPALHHPGPERAVAQHCEGDDAPAERLGDEVGRDLASGEGAVREIPQRAFPADGL